MRFTMKLGNVEQVVDELHKEHKRAVQYDYKFQDDEVEIE